MDKVKLTIAFSVLTIPLQTSIASEPLSERKLEAVERHEFRDVLRKNAREFSRPITDAGGKGDYKKAASLFEASAEQWSDCKWQSNWGREMRRDKIISDLEFAAINLSRAGQNEQAAKYYLRCNEIGRKNGLTPYLDLAYAARECLAAKEFLQAEQIYKTLIKEGVGDTYTDPHIALSQVYEAQGRLSEAEKNLQEFLAFSLSKTQFAQSRAAREALLNFYKRQRRDAEAEKMQELLEDEHCPICGSDCTVVHIVYGLPTKLTPKNVHLGECLIGTTQFYCEQDHIEF